MEDEASTESRKRGDLRSRLGFSLSETWEDKTVVRLGRVVEMGYSREEKLNQAAKLPTRETRVQGERRLRSSGSPLEWGHRADGQKDGEEPEGRWEEPGAAPPPSALAWAGLAPPHSPSPEQEEAGGAWRWRWSGPPACFVFRKEVCASVEEVILPDEGTISGKEYR